MSRTFSPSQTSERNLSEAAFSASEKLFLNSVIRRSDDCVARVPHALASQLAILCIRAKKTCLPAGDGHIHPSFGDGLAISLDVAKPSGYWYKATINQLGARRSNNSNEGLFRHRNEVIVPIRYAQNVKVEKLSLYIVEIFSCLGYTQFSLQSFD
jgi:hypothetical protein